MHCCGQHRASLDQFANLGMSGDVEIRTEESDQLVSLSYRGHDDLPERMMRSLRSVHLNPNSPAVYIALPLAKLRMIFEIAVDLIVPSARLVSQIISFEEGK